MAAKSLILVENASKAKTLKKLLGSSYSVLSTEGFLKAMPKSRLAIDEENNYAADYKTIRGQGENLKKLKKATLDAGRIFIASNPDSEGEFFANQCCEIFGINEESRCRVVCEELTKDALKSAIENAHPIDMNLSDAYQAKQLVDKIASHKIGEYFSYKIWRGNKVGRFRAMLLKLIAGEQPTGIVKLPSVLKLKDLYILAANNLKFSAPKTSLVLTQLYEGINFGKNYVSLIKFPTDEVMPTSEDISMQGLREYLNRAQFDIYSNIYWSYHATNFHSPIQLDGNCNDVSLMVALNNLKVDWTSYYSVGISSLLKRQYVTFENGAYKITELGEKILAALGDFFDKDFSAEAYNKFNKDVKKIAEGKIDKISVIDAYCKKFNKSFKKAMATLPPDAKIQEAPVIETDEICEKCGNKMVLKHGRYGSFLSCSNSECKNNKPYFEKIAQVCPKCGEQLTKRIFKGGKVLYACQKCDFRTWDEPLEKPCKVCNSTMFAHKFKGRSPMLYCGNENCSTRSEHPINKILDKLRKKVES